MKSNKKTFICELIAVILIVVILAGMVVGTVLLSKKNTDDWKYYAANNELDYFTDTSTYDFQYVTIFKNAITTYFGDFVNKYFSVDDYLEIFATKVVSAMSAARVPAQKLLIMSKKLNTNTLFGALNSVYEDMLSYDTIEEWSQSVADKITNFTIFNLINSGLNTFMKESTLTEDEFARFLYYFLAQNTDENYSAYLKLIGESYFEKLFSNTIYVITSMDSIKENGYKLATTAYSLQSVLYQLGSTYTNIAELSGGSITLERVLWWTWDFDKTKENGEQLQNMAESIRGKLGDLILLLGYVMRNVSTADVQNYLKYSSEEEGRAKDDARIYTSMLLSKRIEVGINEARNCVNASYENEEALIKDYAVVANTLHEMTYLMLKMAYDEDYYAICDATNDVYNAFYDAFDTLRGEQRTFEEISAMDSNSTEYQNLLNKAKSVEKIKDCLSGLVTGLLVVCINNGYSKLLEVGNE